MSHATNALMIRSLTPHARMHARILLATVPGLRITSGVRSPERNRAVGGVPGSYHVTGRAIDCVGSGADLARARRAAWEQRVTPRCTGPEEVILEDDHLHIAW